MLKKISILLFCAAIIAGGYVALGKLRYWERSTAIFSYKSGQYFEGRGGRGSGHFEGSGNFQRNRDFAGREGRPETLDSLQHRRERRTIQRDQIIQDNNTQRSDPGIHGIGRGGGRGRAEQGYGRKVSLGNVFWFLLVFSGFTVVMIWLDKIHSFISAGRR